MLSLEPATASRSIHNHFFLFKSAAIHLYFCAILASFKKELKFKSKDFLKSISQKYFVCNKEPENVLLPLKSSPRKQANSQKQQKKNQVLLWFSY